MQSFFLFYTGLVQRLFQPHIFLRLPFTFLLNVLYVCEIGPLFPKKKDLSKKQKPKKKSDHTIVDISALHQQILNQINKKRNINYKNRYDSKEKYKKCFCL